MQFGPTLKSLANFYIEFTFGGKSLYMGIMPDNKITRYGKIRTSSPEMQARELDKF